MAWRRTSAMVSSYYNLQRGEGMEREEAVILLKCHSFFYDDLSHPKMENDFIGSLWPFRGRTRTCTAFTGSGSHSMSMGNYSHG
ncbi:hypothetical protein [Paenibacillus sp. FSL H8-0079]|uniref:hypothetical protein n=1 Tax=Paenibacillus sp. FSL H8-0079 TaxID=2921375 RepID=UPI0030EE564D